MRPRDSPESTMRSASLVLLSELTGKPSGVRASGFIGLRLAVSICQRRSQDVPPMSTAAFVWAGSLADKGGRCFAGRTAGDPAQM